MSRVPRSFLSLLPLVLLFFTLGCSGDEPVGPLKPGSFTRNTSPAAGSELKGFELAVGDTAFFTVAITKYQSLMTFRSSTPAVARVSSTGLITAVAPGTTAITASFGWYYVVIKVDVLDEAPATLAGLALSPATVTVTVGGVQQFATAATWSDGSSATPDLDYSASGGTISATGRYVAPDAPGTYRVVVAERGGAIRDTAIVTVLAETGGSSSGDGGMFRLREGESVYFAVDSAKYQGKMAFSSSTPSVATVSSAGIVTAVAEGAATVTASFGWYVVEKPVLVSNGDTPPAPTLTALALTPGSVSLSVNGVQQFSTTAEWSDGGSTPPSLGYTATGGTISAAGRYVAPNAPGTYRVIVAHTGGTLTDTSVVTVLSDTNGSTPGDHGEFHLRAGETEFFAVDISKYQPLMTFSSSQPSVATVSSAGVVTAVAEGTAMLTASFGWYRVEKPVVVTGGATSKPPAAPEPRLTELQISPSAATLSVSGTKQFSTSAKWSNGATTLPVLTYSASAGSISSTGLYTAPTTPGTYRVFVADVAGQVRDTATVTVLAGTAPSTVTVLFHDDFESGGFSTKSNGVSWILRRWVSITSATHVSGNRSVRFEQGESGSAGGELRFGGLPKLTEAYIQFYLYQPSGNESPSLGKKVRVPTDGKNDKFFRIWGGSYITASPKFGASTWGVNGVGELGTEFNNNLGTRMLGMGQGGSPYKQIPKFPFIGAPQYLGRWVRVRIRVKVASAANNDGVIQIWFDDTMASNKTNLPAYAWKGKNNYFTTGYLLGWAGSGFAPGVNYYMDDVTISTGGFPPG